MYVCGFDPIRYRLESLKDQIIAQKIHNLCKVVFVPGLAGTSDKLYVHALVACSKRSG